ncbi:stress induced protein [Parasponia andersonii]|uniref:Stress induced protein n=1 Tax=Parasponia andersonii TaxID=3476 RepID=A0A2P5D1H9_PARAD|nr:stress induced protein [Parasponia andersonii]
MAEKPIFTTLPQNENYYVKEALDDDCIEEESEYGTRCGCFQVFGIKRGRSNGEYERHRLLCRETKTWLAEKISKVKEFSEVIAGPKWKNLVRKIGGYIKGNKKQQNMARFQYDSQSYALNFDNGGGFNGDEDGPLIDYSNRFTPPFHAEN